MKLHARLFLQLLCVVICSYMIAGCQKEGSDETVTNRNNNNNNGGSGTYQPMTKNSFWKYKTTGFYTLANTTTCNGQKRTVNGIEYTVFTSVNTGQPAAEALFAIKDHNYYQSAQGVAPSGATFNLNYLYLNDTASVGYTWQHIAGQANGFTALTPGTIVEKGLSMTVEGKNYKDVIHTRIDLQYDMPGFGLLTFGTYDYYIAKNIGIIKGDVSMDPILAGGVTTTTNLVDYSIK